MGNKKGWGHTGPPYLSLVEIECLIAVAPEEHRLLLRVIAYTGCRVSEILKLDAKNVDFDNRELKVAALKSRKERFKFVVVHDPTTWGMLEQYARRKRGLLFPLSRQRVWQIVREAGEGIGIRGLHPHTLRDSFAVAWVKAGGDLTMLQRQFGHESYTTTADRYLKYRTADIAEEGQKLQQAIVRTRNGFNLSPGRRRPRR